MCGILMSMSTTSGLCFSAALTASAPSAASATTGIPAAAEDHPESGADQGLIVGDHHRGLRGYVGQRHRARGCS